MERLLNITTGLSVALILLVLHSMRREHIRVEYSVSWLMAAVVLLLLSRSREVLTRLGEVLGTGDTPSALMFISAGVFLLVFYRFSAVISDLKDSHIALTQKIAMLEYRIHLLHEERESSAAG